MECAGRSTARSLRRMWDAGEQVLEGRFRIVSSIAQQGLTEVYLAEQLSLGRRVVLRVIRTPLAEKFDEQMRQLATVEHSAVLRVIDSGRADSLQYFVSEFAEGPRLAGELRGEPLLPERALELLTQIAEGLASIHDKGLVHGALTAASVVLVKGARGEQARLGDFGLGWLWEPPIVADVGTDLRALGTVAYHALSGVPPDPASPKELGVAAPHLADHKELCALVMRCLEKQGTAQEAAKKFAELPRPAEPTIFLETMQRPPPVPAKAAPQAAPPPLPPAAAAPPAPVAPAAPLAPSGKAPLLASVMTMTMPVEAAQKAAPAAAAPVSPSRKWWPIAAGAIALALIVVVVTLTRDTTKRDARRLIERRQPAQALELIGKTQRKLSSPDPELTALKVAGLHLSEQHAEEATVFKSLTGASAALDPLVLSGLVEDFAKKEEPSLRALLEALPKQPTQKLLEEFARGPLSTRQWGALRYLDLTDAHGGLSLVEEYAASLESSDCGARKTAVRRLAQLMDDAAEPALDRLRDAPRDGWEKNCGQDEAQAALQTLRKGR